MFVCLFDPYLFRPTTSVTVGRETVELDDLQIDEEKNMEIKFGEVNLKSTKVTKHTMELFLL